MSILSKFFRFKNEGESTLATPSGDLIQALVGFPSAAGKPVTRSTAVRVAAFLAGVKMMSNDIAKMPLILRETKLVDGRQRTQAAIDEPLYTLLKDCPNSYQTSYQMRWFLTSQLIMNGNCFCQKITDRAGDILSLIPLNAWGMEPHWDRSTNPPTLLWRYSDGAGNYREFTQDEIWHVSSVNLDGFGIEGSPIIVLAKEALSILMAAEETAGRSFANGLGMAGFLTTPPDTDVTEQEAQNVVDRLRKDFSGSQNAGKFTLLPGGIKFEKMTFTAQESQLLESRKWNEQEVIRLLGGAPLLVKLGLGEQNSTYAASSAFLDEYFNTCLLPYTTAIEQSITRDLITRKQWGTIYAKHDTWVVLRGSPKDRADYYDKRILDGTMSPNMVAILEDEDTIPGFGDYRFFPANSGCFDPATGESFLPAQKAPTPNPDEESQPTPGDEGKDSDTPPLAGPDTAANGAASNRSLLRLQSIANSLVERIERKAAKATLTAQFVAEVLNCPLDAAQGYCNTYNDMTPEARHTALLALVLGDNFNETTN
jgi:HK97 family phage portal protein